MLKAVLAWGMPTPVLDDMTASLPLLDGKYYGPTIRPSTTGPTGELAVM
jgi:hypothetical protein